MEIRARINARTGKKSNERDWCAPSWAKGGGWVCVFASLRVSVQSNATVCITTQGITFHKYVNMFVEITRDIYMNTQRHDVSECLFVCV